MLNIKWGKLYHYDSYQDGFSIVEMLVALAILAIISSSMLGFYSVMVQSTFIAKRRSVASSLATNQMEYLKSLPYNSLAVAGGSIVSSSPLPATSTNTVNNVTYITTTSINYVDDAFDGCGSYSTLADKIALCRNYPPPSGAPATDISPYDYKSVHVSVTVNSLKIAEVDTKISAKVAETASNTGALFVKVIDNSGNPVSGATVNVNNATTSPVVAVADSTDANGNAVFYGLPPDTTSYDYVVSASLAGYSSLTTIAPNGALQPSYPSLQIITQQSSSSTLTLRPMGQYSIYGEVVNTSGSDLSNVKIYAKGGYKKYTATSDTTYYFDNVSPSDTRPTTNSNGEFTLQNLVPSNYIFCGDTGSTSCNNGGTNYFLAAAVPYSGTNTLNPITVPNYLASSPPTTVFPFSGNNYLQKVRLILTTNASFPRVISLAPYQESLAASDIAAFPFTITGVNLSCSSTAASCSTSVKFVQSSNNYVASCTGNNSGVTINCTVNLTGATAGNTQLVVANSGNTLTLPGAPLIGGLVITP